MSSQRARPRSSRQQVAPVKLATRLQAALDGSAHRSSGEHTLAGCNRGFRWPWVRSATGGVSEPVSAARGPTLSATGVEGARQHLTAAGLERALRLDTTCAVCATTRPVTRSQRHDSRTSPTRDIFPSRPTIIGRRSVVLDRLCNARRRNERSPRSRGDPRCCFGKGWSV